MIISLVWCLMAFLEEIAFPSAVVGPVDFLAFSVHKMAGPTGMGVLYGKQHILEELPQFLVGGETVMDSTYESKEIAPLPDKFEAGLQNYASAMGAGAAAEYLTNIGLDNIHNHEIELNQYYMP